MKKNYVKTGSLFIGLIFLLLVESVAAKQNDDSERITMKLNASLVNAEPYKYENKIVQTRYKPQFGITLQYEVFKNFDAGIYFAYSNIGHLLSYDIEVVDGLVVSEYAESVRSRALYYGLNFNYHLLPLLLKKNNLRFDIYPIANLGLVSRSWGEPDGTAFKIDPFLEYHVGLGLGYKFTRRFGLFGEYTMGRFYNEGKSKATLGFLLKF